MFTIKATEHSELVFGVLGVFGVFACSSDWIPHTTNIQEKLGKAYICCICMLKYQGKPAAYAAYTPYAAYAAYAAYTAYAA